MSPFTCPFIEDDGGAKRRSCPTKLAKMARTAQPSRPTFLKQFAAHIAVLRHKKNLDGEILV